MKKFEIDIDEVKSGDVDDYERLLRKFRYFLHDNHYWEARGHSIPLSGTENQPQYWPRTGPRIQTSII